MSAPDRDAKNGYPTVVIKKNSQTLLVHSPAPGPMTPRATVIIPYVRHVSKTIQRILTPLGIRTCFRPHHTLRQTLVNLKDRIPLQQRAGVVYRVPCGTCPKAYVGQTCWTLDHRLKEHRRALTSGNLAQSAIAEHAAQESHVIGKRPRWWTPTHATTRDVHLNRGVSDQRPPQ